MMWQLIIGLLLISAAVWQGFASHKAFRTYRANATKTDSPFRVFGYLYGFFFTALLAMMGIVELLIFFGIKNNLTSPKKVKTTKFVLTLFYCHVVTQANKKQPTQK
ncbi:hypothetical protein [Leuconostoc falkenbergense]|uniref:hypothetical protein n=1 Tax=Leuconostoc falkenbergense TaxID=2766470 RepID=UPI003F96DDAB